MGQELYNRLEAITGGFSKTRKEVSDNVDLKKYPLVTEPALVHPLNSSIVKIRENGAIDVFVGTDNGIRIDPNQRSISMLSNTYGQKSTYHKQSVSRDAIQEVGGNWKLNVKGNVEIAAKGKVNLTAGKGVHIEGRTIPQWLDTIQST